MKKIPTLYQRVFEDHKKVGITPDVTPGCEKIANGEGYATIKYDGSCCTIINGELYKRYDAKRGKPVPEGAIKCQENADPVTGHLPCWVKCNRNNPADKWFFAAFDNTSTPLTDGTYEAIGPHFQTNPYRLTADMLIKHGENIVEVGRTVDELKDYLNSHYIEGLVFWLDGVPVCKIKRSDFQFEWGSEKAEI